MVTRNTLAITAALCLVAAVGCERVEPSGPSTVIAASQAAQMRAASSRIKRVLLISVRSTTTGGRGGKRKADSDHPSESPVAGTELAALRERRLLRQGMSNKGR